MIRALEKCNSDQILYFSPNVFSTAHIPHNVRYKSFVLTFRKHWCIAKFCPTVTGIVEKRPYLMSYYRHITDGTMYIERLVYITNSHRNNLSISSKQFVLLSHNYSILKSYNLDVHPAYCILLGPDKPLEECFLYCRMIMLNGDI